MGCRPVRIGCFVLAVGLSLLAPRKSFAQARPTVVWLDYGMPDHDTPVREARARALELELAAREYVLLEGGAGDPRDSPEQASLSLLARTDAAAVMWLGADPERPVSWLYVRARGRGVAKAPLTHPPDAIDPQLLAIAAASLLDQTLRDALEPAPTPVGAPAAVQPAFAKAARPVYSPAPRAAPRLLFAQLGPLLTFAVVTGDMQTARREPVGINNAGVAPLGGLRLALGGWALPYFALVSYATWHASYAPQGIGGNLAFGIESQWRVSGARSRGLSHSAVVGTWVGRTETPTELTGGDPSDNALAGPFGARLGWASRYGFSPGAALVVTPSLAMRFPTTQLEVELSFAVEHAF